MKFWVGVFFALLVASPKAEIVSEYETIVRHVEVQPEWESTPILDSLVDWEEHERQDECLWVFIQQQELDITLYNVILAGEWADANGGACLLIGEDDE